MAATGPPPPQQQPTTTAQKLAAINEQTWLTMGNLAEMMTDYEKAMSCYESALRHNPYSIVALTQIASLCRGREQFARAVEYFKRILAIQENNGETWAALGHCYLMMDNLQEAYHAYQQALYHLSNPKDPKLWYGIGILYDRYGSLEHAEEAFSAVMKMDPKFEKANEIYFRLGIIYKQQQKFDLSLQCFRYILQSPPRPLTESDIWFQTGHVYEQQKEYEQAKEAYERVLAENPDHAKVLQQLGWLYHQQNTSFCNQSLAIQYLTRSLKSDSNDAQSWYLLGRCYMAEQNYNKAYEAYQQAVYRDARNPTFWCSIGVLYYQINQYRDALDAYSRAIRLNPYISEVWYDLGTLYESCNNQIQDALDAYQRAAELDPSNPHIKQRLELLRKSQSHTPQAPGSAPTPQDVSNPNQYQSGNAQPLNVSPYGQTSAPSGPPNGMSAYHTGPTPPQQRSAEERGPPPHLPMSLPTHEANAGPGRDLPMPSGPPPQASPATGRRSPGPYPPTYPPPSSAPREDVRIPDIGNGGRRAPTPSDQSQMNPIMQENARSQPPTMPGPPHGGQPGLPGLQYPPYGKPSDDLRAGEPTRPPPIASPHSRPSHGSPKPYDALPPHHRSSPAEQQHYEMSSHHHPDYDRHHTSSSRPSADSHYPSRQEPVGYPHPAADYRPSEDSHRPHPTDVIKQEHERPARSPHYETRSPPTQSRPAYHPESRREPYESAAPSVRARATDDDYDASAADMLLSIGQSRGDKRAYPPDDTRSAEDPKRMRPNDDTDKPASPPAPPRQPSPVPSPNAKPESPVKQEPAIAQETPKVESTSSLPPPTSPPTTTEQPPAPSDSETNEPAKQQEEEEEEEGEVRDEADQPLTKTEEADTDIKETTTDEQEEGEVDSGNQQQQPSPASTHPSE